MKKNEQYEINHIDETIILTKKFRKAAGTLNTPEYKQLMELKRKHPTYKLVEREIKKSEGKATYASLTVEEMKKFIRYIHEDDNETMGTRLNELAELERFYDEFHASAKYGVMKKWFLGYYKEEYTKKTETKAA